MNPDYIMMTDIVDVWWEWNEPQIFPRNEKEGNKINFAFDV